MRAHGATCNKPTWTIYLAVFVSNTPNKYHGKNDDENAHALQEYRHVVLTMLVNLAVFGTQEEPVGHRHAIGSGVERKLEREEVCRFVVVCSWSQIGHMFMIADIKGVWDYRL